MVMNHEKKKEYEILMRRLCNSGYERVALLTKILVLIRNQDSEHLD